MYLLLYEFFLTNLKAEIFFGKANDKGLNHYGNVNKNDFY